MKAITIQLEAADLACTCARCGKVAYRIPVEVSRLSSGVLTDKWVATQASKPTDWEFYGGNCGWLCPDCARDFETFLQGGG